MSDISLNERSSFGNISSQSLTTSRPKFQPVRVRALLDFCESDDEESEGRSQASDVDSDSEELELLRPQNDSITDVLNTSFEGVKNQPVKSNLETEKSIVNEVKENYSTSKRDHKEVHSKCPTNESNGNNKEENIKVPDTGPVVNVGNNVEHNVLENNKLKHNYGQAYENKQSTKSDKTTNSDLPTDRQLSYENIKESSVHMNRKEHLVHIDYDKSLNIERERHTPAEIIEGHNQSHDIQVHGQNNICSTTVKNLSSTSQSHAQSSQNVSGKYEAFKKCSSGEQPRVENKMEHLTIDTPLKQTHMTTARPNPCYSRRNIVNTPQSSMSMDVGKSHDQTPARILSHWAQSNVGRTPLEPKSMTLVDSLQTPKTSVCIGSNAAMHNTPRYFATERKSVRRPLADASVLVQSDVLAYPLDSKSRLLQGPILTKLEEAPNAPNENLLNPQVTTRGDSIKKALIIPDKAVVQSDVQRNEVLKENRHPSMDIPYNKERAIHIKATESRPPHLNTHVDTKNNCIQMQEKSIKDTNSSCQEPEKSCATINSQNKQQELREVVSKVSTVHFTVPSQIRKTKPSETIVVKGREYLILGTLGKGMSGEVLRVQDLTSFELCAIKCVNLSRMDKDSAQGCLEEISMLHKLQAPCIVKMFDFEIKAPMVYVVMEMGDTDLSRLLKSMSLEKQLPLTMILYYWTEMLVAVKHIHDNGVIHSDLKPANFLLVRGRLKLIDFGIASSMNADMTSVVKSCPIGTLNYISPEALLDIGGSPGSPNHNVRYKITFKSDVWSLGCILYSLVYGHTPFQHIRQQWAKVNAITNPKPNISFPSTLSGGDNAQSPMYVPPILIDVMRKCLQHDPKTRPTVAQLLQVPYIPTKPERTISTVSSFPMNMLVQAKNVLNEEEWRRLTELLEKVRLSSSC